ncbi:hypothetical protein KSZ_77820 [Dictyobacter formicarum]|uniref:5-methyltetrahydropteroyltriglutamate--homocysteine S-methyltransferase n=1 Tax=Dictyobacter formicarum TaxID=2778368 RepID=A0ABQ3VXK2_9CHLR|nr:hypothetical protein KSZ_77820 [Dictyobacter formicarum]
MYPHETKSLTLLDRLLPIYEEVLRKLSEAGADWIQIDEPCLTLDLDTATIALFQQVYRRLSAVSSSLRLLLATYFGDLGPHTPTILHLPVAAVHLDLVRAPQQLALALEEAPGSLILSLGVVDGRNVWRTDLDHAITLIREAVQKLGTERVLLAPSCSLLHVPVDLAQETHLGNELMQWLAFARQKLEEVVLLTRLHQETDPASLEQQAAARQALEQRWTSPIIHDPKVKQHVAAVKDHEARRQSPFAVRQAQQQQILALPLLPTTTIGSFPQTEAVRTTRAAYTSGKLVSADYETFLREEITRTIRFQEEIGLDVLVHGEFERTDMVEYFGKLLNGFAFTLHGWVQSYGSRCVRPPILYGDVTRPEPMTVRWSTFAQSLTERPVKGMLTGPVTILQWSFVRDDQPRRDTCYQLALALREEVQDLEAAGIRVIQIDEPALREGLPLRHSAWAEYLAWAVNCFRLVSSSVLMRRRFIPICVIRNSETSLKRLPAWMRMSSPSRPPAPAWNCWRRS